MLCCSCDSPHIEVIAGRDYMCTNPHSGDQWHVTEIKVKCLECGHIFTEEC